MDVFSFKWIITSFKHYKHSLETVGQPTLQCNQVWVELFTSSWFFFSPQAAEIHMSTQIGLKISQSLVGLEYVVVQM